jgi:Mor family transcriptional regulator
MADTESDFYTSGPEILVDLAQKVAARLVGMAGLAQDVANQVAIQVAEDMAEDWGGQIIYVPKGRAYQIAKAHLEIWRKFTGDNHAELASEFDLTVPAIYRILKRVRRQEMAKRQGDMFQT